MEPTVDLRSLTADIVSAHVAHNSVAVGDVPALVERVYGALAGLNAVPTPEPVSVKTPAVSARASVRPDYLACMECGKKQKMLKRHLQTAHGMTPQQYRQAFTLPSDYPMVAANYAATRRELAISIGLGRKPKAPARKRTRQPRSTPPA